MIEGLHINDERALCGDSGDLLMRLSLCNLRSSAATLGHDDSYAVGASSPACSKWRLSGTCTEPAGPRPRPASSMVAVSPSPSWGDNASSRWPCVARRAARVAVAGTTYALVRVMFGWHQAPSLEQHLITVLLSDLPGTQVVAVQYLDDILFVGRNQLLTTQVARDTAAHLAHKGFLVSPKSVMDATQSFTWMGKQLSLDRPRVAHKPEGLAGIVGRWVAFSLSRHTRKPLKQLLGRIGRLARPGFSAGCFLAVAGAWLRLGPPSAHCVPFAVCRGLLEAIAAGAWGWEPQPTEGPAIRLYIDAAACPCAPGGFFVGVRSLEGVTSAGARSGSIASSPLNCSGYCVRSMLRGVPDVSM